MKTQHADVAVMGAGTAGMAAWHAVDASITSAADCSCCATRGDNRRGSHSRVAACVRYPCTQVNDTALFTSPAPL
jgi:cation diffusion facilitator CzcD-associated flavoprotein CzcO